MAATKDHANPAKATKGLSAPLEGPVSLLWAYQLRREHALLLTRIESLADTIRSDDAAAHLKQLNVELEALRARMTAAEKEKDSRRLDLQVIRAKSSGADAVADIRLKISEHEKQQREQVEHVKVELERAFEARLQTQQEQIGVLLSKTSKIEDQLEELGPKDMTVIRDSIEDIPEPNRQTDFRKPQLINNSNVSKKLDQRQPKAFSRANDLLQEIEEENSNMLALHPVERIDETPTTEFDLDAGVETMSYARHLRRKASPEDSMAMLPELPCPESHHEQAQQPTMRQGAESWEHYLAEGRAMVRAAKKRKEGAIVDAFVAGITESILRAECEHWLDERIWIWEQVETFPAQRRSDERPDPSSTADPSPALQRMRRPPKGQLQSQAVTKELSRLLEDQGNRRVQSQVVAASQEVDGIRRSQRLAKKRDRVDQNAKGINPSSECHTSQLLAKASNSTPASRKWTANGCKPRQANTASNHLAQPPLKPLKATQLKQAVISDAKRADKRNEGQKTLRGPVKPDKAPVPLIDKIQEQDMEIEDITDPNLRAKVRRMHDLFPRETARWCYGALLKNGGNLEDACGLVKLKTQPAKPKSIRDVVLPSTPTPVDRSVNTFQLARIKAVSHRPDLYKTPQHRLMGRTSYKRKLDLPDRQTATKKLKLVKKKKRGPPPMIPILPSSDTE